MVFVVLVALMGCATPTISQLVKAAQTAEYEDRVGHGEDPDKVCEELRVKYNSMYDELERKQRKYSTQEYLPPEEYSEESEVVLDDAYASATTYVGGYVRKNGTYVQAHYRTGADSTRANNWSTKGNSNPYTGKRGSKK